MGQTRVTKPFHKLSPKTSSSNKSFAHSVLIARTDKILRHATACVTEQRKIRAKLEPINDEIAVRRLHDATRPFNAVVPTDDPVGSGEGVAGDDDPFQLVVHEADHFEEESEHSIRH